MKALSKLQSSIIVQTAQVDGAAAALGARAREYAMVGALVALAMTSSPAKAQDGPMTPSSCASVGAVVGGVAGGASNEDAAKRTIFAAIGALGGAAVGHWMCNPKPMASQDSSYGRAASYEGAGVVGPAAGKAPLSFSERELLDGMSLAAMDAKFRWKMALWNVAQAERTGASSQARQAGRATEAEARRDFVAKRDTFASTVARLNNGTGSLEPRAVGRYLEISAALLELDANARVSYQMLEARDEQLKARNHAYQTEADRAAAVRLRG